MCTNPFLTSTERYAPRNYHTQHVAACTLRFNPSATRIEEDILVTARSFTKMGLLSPRTDPVKLVQKTYANVFQRAGEPVPTF